MIDTMLIKLSKILFSCSSARAEETAGRVPSDVLYYFAPAAGERCVEATNVVLAACRSKNRFGRHLGTAGGVV